MVPPLSPAGITLTRLPLPWQRRIVSLRLRSNRSVRDHSASRLCAPDPGRELLHRVTSERNGTQRGAVGTPEYPIPSGSARLRLGPRRVSAHGARSLQIHNGTFPSTLAVREMDEALSAWPVSSNGLPYPPGRVDSKRDHLLGLAVVGDGFLETCPGRVDEQRLSCRIDAAERIDKPLQ